MPTQGKTLDRILVAVSFSERSIDAVRKAARLAADRKANLTLLHVVEPVKRRSVRSLPAQQTLLRARVIHARRELARYAGEIAARDRLAVDFRIEIGDTVGAIMRSCKDADVLFIGGTSMTGLTPALHTKTAERLVGNCGIPVLVVNAPHAGRFERALVPVDGSYRSTAAVSAALRLWPDAKTTRLEAAGSARMMRILEATDEVDAHVVVLVKRKATRLADFILGSTLRRLLARLRCDVLLIPEPEPTTKHSAERETGPGPRAASPARASSS